MHGSSDEAANYFHTVVYSFDAFTDHLQCEVMRRIMKHEQLCYMIPETRLKFAKLKFW